MNEDVFEGCVVVFKNVVKSLCCGLSFEKCILVCRIVVCLRVVMLF